MRTRGDRGSWNGAGAVLLALAATLVFAPVAGGATHTNTNGFGPPDTGPGQTSTAIAVAGESGTVTKVRVTLTGAGIDSAGDLDLLLVGPAGQRGMLMSDACAAGSFGTNAILVFDDSAGTPIQDMCGINNSGGTFAPTNVGAGDTFDPPAPGPPYPATLSGFVGAQPNGTWTLFAVDDQFGAAMFISGGWSLDLTTTPPPTVANPTPTPPAAKTCPKKKKLKKGKCVKKKKRKK